MNSFRLFGPQGVLYTFRPQMSLIFNISYSVTDTPTPRDAITSKNASVVCVAYIDVSVGLIIFYNISSILYADYKQFSC